MAKKDVLLEEENIKDKNKEDIYVDDVQLFLISFPTKY